MCYLITYVLSYLFSLVRTSNLLEYKGDGIECLSQLNLGSRSQEKYHQFTIQSQYTSMSKKSDIKRAYQLAAEMTHILVVTLSTDKNRKNKKSVTKRKNEK
ncbi:hypothetical protein NUACC21_29190 [Scytonema sp. NUACC21]